MSTGVVSSFKYTDYETPRPEIVPSKRRSRNGRKRKGVYGGNMIRERRDFQIPGVFSINDKGKRTDGPPTNRGVELNRNYERDQGYLIPPWKNDSSR